MVTELLVGLSLGVGSLVYIVNQKKKKEQVKKDACVSAYKESYKEIYEMYADKIVYFKETVDGKNYLTLLYSSLNKNEDLNNPIESYERINLELDKKNENIVVQTNDGLVMVKLSKTPRVSDKMKLDMRSINIAFDEGSVGLNIFVPPLLGAMGLDKIDLDKCLIKAWEDTLNERSLTHKRIQEVFIDFMGSYDIPQVRASKELIEAYAMKGE